MKVIKYYLLNNV